MYCAVFRLVFFCFCFLFWNRLWLQRQDRPGKPYVDQSDLKFNNPPALASWVAEITDGGTQQPVVFGVLISWGLGSLQKRCYCAGANPVLVTVSFLLLPLPPSSSLPLSLLYLIELVFGIVGLCVALAGLRLKRSARFCLLMLGLKALPLAWHLFYYYFTYVGVLSASISVYYMCAVLIHAERENFTPLELELQKVVSYYVGVGSPTLVLRKSSLCLKLQKHLLKPSLFVLFCLRQGFFV